MFQKWASFQYFSAPNPFVATVETVYFSNILGEFWVKFRYCLYMRNLALLTGYEISLHFLLAEFGGRLSDAELQSMVSFWPEGLWKEYLPILQYCRINGVRLMACGTPPEVAVIFFVLK